MINTSNADEFAKQLLEYSNQFMNDAEINSFIADGIRSASVLKIRRYSDEFISNLADEIENLD